MSYGNKGRKFTHRMSLKNQGKNGDRAYIEVYDVATKQNIDEVNDVDGEIIEIKFGVVKNKDKTQSWPNIEIVMIDGKECYKIQTLFTSISRMLLNKLLSAEKFDNIRIGYWGEAKEYKALSVQSHGIELKALISKEEREMLVKKYYKDDGVTLLSTDYVKYDQKLIDKVNAVIVPRLKPPAEPIVEEHGETQEDTPDDAHSNSPSDMGVSDKGTCPF